MLLKTIASRASCSTKALLVPVMDLYRDFFQAYPAENELRPLLIKAYHDLKLMDLKEKEAITFNTIEMERQL